MIWLLAALALDRVQLLVADRNNCYAPSPYRSGYGAIDLVNSKKAFSPMAYRVLVPWLIAILERLFHTPIKWRLTLWYEPIKIMIMAVALWGCSLAIGPVGALLVGCMWCVTFWTDYWDGYIEIAALAFAMTGRIELAVVGAVMLGLSRETAPLVGLTYFLVTGDFGSSLCLFTVSFSILSAVRICVGDKKLYCSRWMWRQNIIDLKAFFCNRPWFISENAFSVYVTLAIFLLPVYGDPGWQIAAILVIMGWLMGRAAEVRIFGGALVWIVGMMV